MTVAKTQTPALGSPAFLGVCERERELERAYKHMGSCMYSMNYVES